MFEKEAEEYRKELKSKFFLSEPQLDLASQGFKDGAEFGYNKANEWHDLRKNPKDLPRDNKDVLIYSGDEWRMTIGRYYPEYKSWEVGCDTIAWKEIPEPPKQEENGNECHDCVAFDAMPRAPRCRSCDNGSRFKAREEK